MCHQNSFHITIYFVCWHCWWFIQVTDVKQIIETAQGADVYPAPLQMLIHQGKVLKDSTTLEENKVAENSFIVIMLSKVHFSYSMGVFNIVSLWLNSWKKRRHVKRIVVIFDPNVNKAIFCVEHHNWDRKKVVIFSLDSEKGWAICYCRCLYLILA